MDLIEKLTDNNPNFVLDLLPEEKFKRLNTDCYPNILKNRYWISTKNRVYDEVLKKLKTISHSDPNKSDSPYYSVNLCVKEKKTQKEFLMHRLLMMTFEPLGNVEKMKKLQINHKDGNKLNNELWNLEWCTQRENTIHALETGLFKPVYGEKHCCATITEKTANKICQLLVSRKYTQREIAELMNTTLSIVCDISMGKSWKHVSKNYDFSSMEHRVPKNFTFEQIHQCCKYFQEHPKGENQSLRNYLIECLNKIDFRGELSEGNLNSIRLLYNRKRYEFISNQYNF